MTRVLMTTLLTLGFTTAVAHADLGQRFVDALKHGKGKAAAALVVQSGLKVGVAGNNEVLEKKIPARLTKMFRKLKRQYAKQPAELGTCTTVGRELGYMSNEWSKKDEALAEWIRDLPVAFCESNDIKPPRVWLVKDLDSDVRPHAVVLFSTGEDDLITGFYTF